MATTLTLFDHKFDTMTRFLSVQEQFLADFHDRNAGITTRAYQSLPVAMGGVFAFAVGARPPPGAAFDRYLAGLLEIRQRHPSSSLNFGDRRLRSPEDIQALLAPCFEQVVIEELVLPRRYTPQQLWAWFEDMYDLHLIPAQERQQFRNKYLEEIQAIRDDDGKRAFTDKLRLVRGVVRKID